MSNKSTPLVSIGLPVFNEGKYISLTLQALLEQSYKNIEIIISDNASSDSTFDICQERATEDARIKLLQNPENIGVSENSRIVLREASGEYFMWASGHDLWEKDFIESAVKTLESKTDAVICFAVNKWIDGEGKELPRKSGWSDTIGLAECSRLVLTLLGNMNPVLGLIRRKAIQEIPKIQGCAGADLLVLSELSLKGTFVNITNTSWSRREFRDEKSYSEKLERYNSKAFNLIESNFSRLFPNLNILIHLYLIIFRAKIKLVQKLILIPSIPLFLMIKLIDFKASQQ